MSWQLAYPWVLIFGLMIPVIWIVQIVRSRFRAGMMSSTPSRIAAAGGSARTMTAWMPTLLWSIAAGLILIAIARPQEILDNTTTTRDAIALELVVDRSGSMDERVRFGGREMSRLEAVKGVLKEFIVGDGAQLKGREGDLLGLIVFGSFADTLMPLTQSHDALVEALGRVEIPKIKREQYTAIGDALMLAIARLKASEDAMRRDMEDSGFELKSKAVILLTDGSNTVGNYSPKTAAGLAKDWGIKIYIIGVHGNSNAWQQASGRIRNQQNDQEMTRVAQYTGGQYWGVDQIGDLQQVYAQIDELERSSIQTTESTTYREWYQPIAIAGLGMYVLSSLLSGVVYRRVL
jgi:Ca-activated chloride channel homolog